MSANDAATLRDYFAANANESDIQEQQWTPEGKSRDITRQRARYLHADAMLAEREKGGGK
jgi:hypothetical protein